MRHFSAISIVALLIAICGMASGQEKNPWSALRIFEGKWHGSTTGKPGKGSTDREFHFELNGKFLYQHDRSVYQPSDPAGKPVVHEDVGYFSYDADAKKLVWRQFHSEGYVNEYVMDSISPDGEILEFVTTRIENLPGFRAKKVYRTVSNDQIEETFQLAAPGQDFEIYTQTDLRRVSK